MDKIDVEALGKEIAQQIAEQTGQAVSQAIHKLLQTTGATTTGTGVFTRQELGDIGGTERLEKDQMGESSMLFSNMKRTYDEYQQESLESIKRNRTYVDKVLSDALQYDNQRQVIANQALQNAVETANMVGKQSVRHGDIAIDQEWNPVQQGAGDVLTARAVSLDDASLKAIGAIIATALADALKVKTN